MVIKYTTEVLIIKKECNYDVTKKIFNFFIKYYLFILYINTTIISKMPSLNKPLGISRNSDFRVCKWTFRVGEFLDPSPLSCSGSRCIGWYHEYLPLWLFWRPQVLVVVLLEPKLGVMPVGEWGGVGGMRFVAGW